MPMSAYKRELRALTEHTLLMTPGVVALIHDDQGRLLLQQRGDGRWGLPAGEIDPGETPADALAREMWEEMGVRVTAERLAGAYAGPDWHVVHPGGDEDSVLDLAFDCRIDGGKLRPDGDEVLAVDFFSVEEALALEVPDRVRRRYAMLLAEHPQALFAPATWQPPADGIRSNGISPYLRELRAVIGTDLIMVVGAGAVIFDEQGCVLMQRRGDTGRWGIIGGALDPGEQPADAVKREVWEETGLLVEPVRVVGVYGGPDYHAVYPNGDEISVTSVMFECRVTGGELSADGQESLALAYLTPEEIRQQAHPPRMWQRVMQAVEQRASGETQAAFTSSTWMPPAS